MGQKKSKTRQLINIRMRPDLLERLRKESAKRRETMTSIIEQAVSQKLSIKQG